MKPVKGKIYEIIYVPTYPNDNDEAYNGMGRCTEDSAVDECEVGDLYEFELLSGDFKGRMGLYADEDIMSEKQEG
jgi:hypothetical protein